MFAPIFWDRGDGITPTLSLYLPEINPHNNPIVGAANMQEMPRFSKAPRPPDGFIKGAYWAGAYLLPIAYCLLPALATGCWAYFQISRCWEN